MTDSKPKTKPLTEEDLEEYIDEPLSEPEQGGGLEGWGLFPKRRHILIYAEALYHNKVTFPMD